MRDSAVLWADVVHLGRRAARFFRLPGWKKLRFEPFPPFGFIRMDGECLPGRAPLIRLRLHRVGKPTQAMGRSTVMSALAHELAHLPDIDHCAEHGELTRQIAEWLRLNGQPVSPILHSCVGRSTRDRRRMRYKRAWKRRRKPCRK